MRPETKKLIQEKLHRWLEGEQTHAIDPNGTWINVRDVRSIIDCETELLKKTIDKQKQQLIFAEEIESQLQARIKQSDDSYYHAQEMTSYPHPDILANENNGRMSEQRSILLKITAYASPESHEFTTDEIYTAMSLYAESQKQKQ